jgi:hypothetical protein
MLTGEPRLVQVPSARRRHQYCRAGLEEAEYRSIQGGMYQEMFGPSTDGSAPPGWLVISPRRSRRRMANRGAGKAPGLFHADGVVHCVPVRLFR